MAEITDFNIDQLIELTYKAMEEQKDLSPALKLCIESLILVIKQQNNLIKELLPLRDRVAKLEKQLALNSKNSSKPPSSDPLEDKKKKKVQSDPSNKKPGAQCGHIGSFLKQVENPDEVIYCPPAGFCSRCKNDLKNLRTTLESKRQVFSVLEKSHITEYRLQKGVCRCGKKHFGTYPAGVNYRVQYSEHVKSLAIYFSQVQLIVPARIVETFWDCFELKISEGTIYNIISNFSRKLSGFEKLLIELLLAQEVIHADETPTRVDAGNSYIHVVSSVFLTYLFGHKNRNKQAVKEMGVLENFKGTVVHDCYSMYFGYKDSKHATCGPHLVRELTFCEEQEQQRWAHLMRVFLLDLNSYLKEYLLEKDDLIRLEYSYDQIVKMALSQSQLLEKGSKSIPLAKRLKEKKENILMFMFDPRVPFSNNQAERDLRVSKVKQKISGQFKSLKGLKDFCRIRSFTGTLRKLKINIMDSIKQVYIDVEIVLNQIVTTLEAQN